MPDTLRYYGSTIIETSLELKKLEQLLVYDGEFISEAISWNIAELEDITVINICDFGARTKQIFYSLQDNNQITIIDLQAQKLSLSTTVNFESDIFILENVEDGVDLSEIEKSLKNQSTSYYSLQTHYNWGASYFVTKVVASITSKVAIELTKQLLKKGINFYYHIQNSKTKFVRDYIQDQYNANKDNLWLDSYSKHENKESFILRDLNTEYHIDMVGVKIISSSKKDLRNYL
jgi:hypothetical protein